MVKALGDPVCSVTACPIKPTSYVTLTQYWSSVFYYGEPTYTADTGFIKMNPSTLEKQPAAP